MPPAPLCEAPWTQQNPADQYQNHQVPPEVFHVSRWSIRSQRPWVTTRHLATRPSSTLSITSHLSVYLLLFQSPLWMTFFTAVRHFLCHNWMIPTGEKSFLITKYKRTIVFFSSIWQPNLVVLCTTVHLNVFFFFQNRRCISSSSVALFLFSFFFFLCNVFCTRYFFVTYLNSFFLF